MDKNTLQIAEEVGRFLIPIVSDTVRSLHESAVKDIKSSLEAVSLRVSAFETTFVALRTADDITTRTVSNTAESLRADIAAVQEFASSRLHAVHQEATESLNTFAAQSSAAFDSVAATATATCSRAEAAIAEHARAASSFRDEMTARFGQLQADMRLLVVGSVSSVADQQKEALLSVEKRLLSIEHKQSIIAVPPAETSVPAAPASAEEYASAVVAAVTPLVADVASIKAESKRDIAALTETVDAVVRDLAAAERVVKLLSEKLDKVPLSVVQSDINSIKAAVASSASDNSTLSSRLDALSETLYDIQHKDIVSLREAVGVGSGAVAQLQKTFAGFSETAAAEASAVSKRVADLASRFAELNSQDFSSLAVAQALAAVDQHALDTRRDVATSVQRLVMDTVAALPPAPKGDQGPEGTLPIVTPYTPGSVVARGSVVTYKGGTWQAKRETEDEPASASADWLLLVSGVDAVDFSLDTDMRTVVVSVVRSDGARTQHSVVMPNMVYRGVYSPDKTYDTLDAVTHGGSLWVASEKSVGSVPGKSGGAWKLAVKRGSDGKDASALTATSDKNTLDFGWVGEYKTGTLYPKDAIVEYASSVWMAKRETRTTPPYLTRQDNDDWLRLRG